MTRRLFMILFTTLAPLFGEEGMWTFNALPTELFREKYGIDLHPEWVEHIQKSCLRVSLGGSASFVSSQGLVLTNHHVGSRAIYNLSTQNKNLMNGFLAKTFAEELKCPNMYVDQLISIEDVTDRVKDAIDEKMSFAEKEEKQKAILAEIKKEALDTTGLQPQVVALYQGAIYNLYLYKRYTDVRLVMAPEKDIAFFGGDQENFEYPRYDLDICFFRVYENDQPLQTDHYLAWSEKGPAMLEPLFVAGNPGRTNRMLTSAHLKFLKEKEISLLFEWLKLRKKDLQSFSKRNQENARIAAQDLFSIENSLKVMKSYYSGLSHSSLIQDKEKEEAELFKTIDPQPWIHLADALEKAKTYYPEYMVLEGAGSNYSKLYTWAKQLVRSATELSKPNETRLKEYVDSELPALQLDLFSTEPVYKSLEKVLLQGSFLRTIKILGNQNPVTSLLLAKKPLEERIKEILAKTQLQSLAYRKKLYGNLEEIEKSNDPLIVLAREIDPYARKIREKKTNELDGIQNESYTQIAKDLFSLYGESIYPDATFTLRLSFGSMKGYFERQKSIAPITTIGGAFQLGKMHGFKDPYDLPQSWMAEEKSLNKKTPFNFVSTNDIIGGNSGSPVINQQGQLVGLIFDGNSQSIFWSFKYSDIQGRAVSVHSDAILEALKTVYQADHLVAEIRGFTPN